MALITPAWTQVHPSFIEPDLLMQYNQASGAFDLLPTSQPRVKLSDTDVAVYIKRVEARTRMASSQASYNALPGVAMTTSMISTPTYRMMVRAEYDHHDTAAANEWGISIVDAYRFAMRQGHFQLLRNALLYGLNPVNGEGILNTAGATAVNLPADTNGNTTVVTYDNGQMAFFLLQQILAIKTRTMQLGVGHKFTILGPQRTLGTFEYNVVQLVAYQRPGGGSVSTHGLVDNVVSLNGDEITWVYDDTLIGKGSGGNDAVVLVMPEVERPAGSRFNTNEFAKLAPGLDACLLQYLDMPAPREIPTPLAGGAIDVLSEWKASSGWGIRPEAISIITMQYQ